MITLTEYKRHLIEVHRYPIDNEPENIKHRIESLARQYNDDYLTKIIGFTYYFYNKIEKNAFMNGIYREIIDSYVTGLNTPIIELIKNTQIYKNIQVIKNIVTNKDNWPDLEMRLKSYNITLKSYLKIANIMIQEYTKSFGRTLYKINKDIDEINKTKLINLSNISLDNNN